MDIREYIRQSNLIENIDIESEIDQSLKAWELFSTDIMSHDLIKQAQKVITSNYLDEKYQGKYRGEVAVNVRVGEHHAADHSEVNQLMESWLSDLPKMTPLIAHIRFEIIHPFVDGNGRVGRMIYWWHCLQLGGEPKLYTYDKRDQYYRLFTYKVVDLIKNNWGVDYKAFNWEVTLKVIDNGVPRLVRMPMMEEPTNLNIIPHLPNGMLFSSIVKKTKL